MATTPDGSSAAIARDSLSQLRVLSRFNQRYQEAVKLANAGDVDAAIGVLEALLKTAPEGGPAAAARDLLSKLRSLRSP